MPRRVITTHPRKTELSRAAVASLVFAWAMSAGLRDAGAQPGEPHGFVEPCTVGNLQEMDTDCELCPVTPAQPNACQDRLGPKGYQKKCRTHGTASEWGEVWCVKRNLPAKPPPSSAPQPSSQLIWILLGAAGTFGVALFFWRRKA